MIVLTNTLTRQKEPLSVTGNKVRFYSCGPTVYGLIHIGNLRGALVADLLVRMFHLNGLDVEYVRNFTDVDDKIINKAKEELRGLRGIITLPSSLAIKIRQLSALIERLKDRKQYIEKYMKANK